ncbi:MAG: hypothetical protein EOO24_21705, partial [Comamonadaceae bacterium]
MQDLQADPTALSVRRVSLSQWQAAQAAGEHWLGGISYGAAIPGEPQLAAVATRVLAAQPAAIDGWHGRGKVESGRCGTASWWRDEQWLFGRIDLDEASEGMGLAELSHRAYTDLFATLAATGQPHLLRIWNYVPRINADGGGLERYRQFNAGRQQAFLEARRPVLEGSPAACALGTPAGPLCVRFLAGRAAARPVENPRQVSAYRYPKDYGPRPPTFSRAALAPLGDDRTALLISGTASIVGHDTQHRGDVIAQTQETLRNLQSVVEAAHRHGSARYRLAELDCVVYIRHPHDLPAVRKVLEDAWGSDSHALR